MKKNSIVLSITLLIIATGLLLGSCCKEITKLDAIRAITHDPSNEVVIVKDTVLIHSVHFDTLVKLTERRDTITIQNDKVRIQIVHQDSNIYNVITDVRQDTIFVDKQIIKIVYPQQNWWDRIKLDIKDVGVPILWLLSVIIIIFWGAWKLRIFVLK